MNIIHNSFLNRISRIQRHKKTCFLNVCLLCICLNFISIIGFAGNSNPQQKKIDSISQKIEVYGLSDIIKAHALLDTLYEIAVHSNDSIALKIHCAYLETSINFSQGKNDSNLISKIKFLENQSNIKAKLYDKAVLQYALALAYYTRNDYAKSFTTALQVLEQFKKLKTDNFTSKTLVLLGNICAVFQSYDIAKDYYSQALTFAENPEQRRKIKINIYKIWNATGKTELAIDSLSAMLPILVQQKNNAELIVVYLNLGACHLGKQNYQKAKQCLDSISLLINPIHNNRLASILYQNLGAYYFIIHDAEKSKKYLYKARSIIETDGNMEQLAYSYLGLSKLYEQMGNTDSAFFYLKRYSELNNRISNATKTLEAYRGYISATLESTQKELTIAEQKLLLKNRRFAIAIVSLVSLILLVVLLLIVAQQKKRLKESENKDLMLRLDHEKKIQQLQEEKHKETLEIKNREITSYSLLLSNKNHVLQQIADVVKRLPENQKETSDINNIVKSNMDTDHAWNNFILHFEKVHPDFFSKMSAFSDELTKNDLRLCAYIRIGMDSKQIAQILNISYGSIRMHRYRVKKKLELAEDENLDDFLRKI